MQLSTLVKLVAVSAAFSSTVSASPINTTTVELAERGTGVMRGLAWAADSRWAPTIAKGLVSWYYHWEDGPLRELSGNAKVEFVPCFWGPAKIGDWRAREDEFNRNGLPKNILAQNEIDVSGQANQGAAAAAQSWANTLGKYQKKGVRVSSPQIVWDVNLLKNTATQLKNNYGMEWDYTAIHFYGGWQDLSKFQTYVRNVRAAFPNKPIWVSELGVTSRSGGNQAQIKKFHMDAIQWLATLGYVERVAWFGCFSVSNPPDSYATGLNAFFNSNGSLRDMAYWFMYTS